MTRLTGRRVPSLRLLAAAVLVLVLVTAASGGGGADAQTTTTTQAAGTTTTTDPALRLVEQTAWVGPEGTYRVTMRAEGLPSGSKVRGVLHSRVRTRAAVTALFDDDAVGSPAYQLREHPVAELDPDGDGTFVISMPVSTTEPTAEDGVRLDPAPGVYPFVVQAYDAAGVPVARLVTTLLRLGSPDSSTTSGPLTVGVVVPLGAPVIPGEDGRPVLTSDDTQDLVATIGAVGAQPAVPVTLEPSAEILDLLAADEGTTTAIGELSTRAGRQILAGPYAPIDTGAWTEDGLRAEIGDQWAAGTAALERITSVRPDPSMAVIDRTVTPDALGRLAELGVTSVVVPSDQLDTPLDRTTTAGLADQFEVAAGGTTTVRAVVGDAAASGRLVSTDDPVLAGHRALAELAVLQLGQVGTAKGVAVTVSPATDPTALATLLAGLGDRDGAASGSIGGPMVSPVTLTDLFTGTAMAEVTRNGRTGPEVRTYQSDPPADLGDYPADLRAARDQLAGLDSLVPASSGLSTQVATTILSSGARNLSADQRRAMLDTAADTTDGVTSEIVVSPEQVVTLTSSAGNVPLNLENRLPYEARVRIELASAKLDFPEGSIIEQTIPAAQTTVINLPVETKASGAFPLTVEITSSDGSLPVATTRYTVRSTAISGVGLVLSVGAGLFLLVWWARHFRTARRARQLVASNHPALSGDGPAGYAPPHTETEGVDPGAAGVDPDPPALDPDPMEGR